jgi:hypothetical protein
MGTLFNKQDEYFCVVKRGMGEEAVKKIRWLDRPKECPY